MGSNRGMIFVIYSNSGRLLIYVEYLFIFQKESPTISVKHIMSSNNLKKYTFYFYVCMGSLKIITIDVTFPSYLICVTYILDVIRGALHCFIP